MPEHGMAVQSQTLVPTVSKVRSPLSAGTRDPNRTGNHAAH